MNAEGKFMCDICKYDSDNHWAYKRHLTSHKHLMNVKNKKKIITIQNTIKKNISIDSHLQQIIEEKDKRLEEKDKKIEEKDKKMIEEKDKRLEEKDKIIEEDRRKIEALERQLQTYYNMFSCNPTPSMSIVQYVIKNYNNAPHLTIFANCDKEKKELDQKELEKHEANKKIPINKYVYAEQLINYYNNDKLITVISNSIITEYKKADPSKQAVWTSDTSRLTYLIKQLLKDDTSNWVIDKKGVETCKYIVDPLLNFVRDDLVEYNSRPLKNTAELSSFEMELQSKYMQSGHKIINLIDSGVLKNNILKEITPAFYMSHNKMKTIDPPVEAKINPLEADINPLTEVKIIDPVEAILIEKLTDVKIIEQPAEVILTAVKNLPNDINIVAPVKTPPTTKANPSKTTPIIKAPISLKS